MKTRFVAILMAVLMALTPVLALADAGYVGSGYTGEVISMRVSLRTSASTSAKRILYIENGKSFDIISRNGDWYEINYLDDNGNWQHGYVLACYCVENPSHIVMKESGNLYASPSLTDKRVGTFSRYERFTVIDETNYYYLVSCRNAAAFISKNAECWTDDDLWLMNHVSRVGVTNAKAPIYLNASTKTRVATVDAGTAFDVVGMDGDFYIVKYKTAIAYIQSQYLD